MFRKDLARIAGVFLIAATVSASIDWNDPRSVVDAALTASPSLREMDAVSPQLVHASGAGTDVMKRIAVPMIGGLFTSFLLELLVYPAINYRWKWRAEVRHAGAALAAKEN